MIFDIVYSTNKSLREIKPFKKLPGVDTAVDVMHGGLKLTSGI